MDYPRVKRAKQHVLTEQGAQTKPGQTGMSFPIRAESWAMVASDLTDRGWAAMLCNEGLNPKLPTLWIAEGLLNQLCPKDLQAVLNSCAVVSLTFLFAAPTRLPLIAVTIAAAYPK